MLRKLILPLGLLSAALVACTGAEEIDNAPVAEVTEPTPEPVDEAPKAMEFAGTPLKVDAESSKIEWLGAKVTGTHSGGFKSFEGVAYVEGDAVTGTEFTIDLASVFADAEKLTTHLQTEDFFNVSEFAKATFKANKVVAKVSEGATHEVTGELDLHGVKKEITFPAMVAVAADSVKVNAEFQINRQDWKLAYPGKPDDLIKDEVAIKLDLNFPREAGPAGEATPAAGAAAGAPAGAPAAAPAGKPVEKPAAGVGAGPAKEVEPSKVEQGGAKKGAPAESSKTVKGGEKKK